ncbi:hypothetical protein [uncultured Spirosoma sp.]|uniref:hypothetical protein n=1 Tax=uncultured Spirosoma sp. TaxID=278208 RepID=UPI00258305D0|nr:hypothetical protein [uncultured Spirosoma sp.]
MPDILPLRPSPVKTKPLSTLLSLSKDDFYSELQAVMNTIPVEPIARPQRSGDLAGCSFGK